MLKDLRHAIRMLAGAKGWTAVIVLSLALGIGANTALFSLVNGLLLTKLPVKDPDTLVRFRYVGANDAVTDSSDYGFRNGGRTTFSYPMFQQFVADNRTMSDLFACAPLGRVNVVVDGHAEIARAFISSGNYYRLLGVAARLGRTILPDDDRPAAPAVAVISSPYWHSRFGTDPSIVGKTIDVNSRPVTIVGVLPPDFTGVQQPVAEPPDISFPLWLDPQLEVFPQKGPPRLAQATTWWLQVMGRLRPGVSAEQVQGNLEGVFQHTARAAMESYLKSLPEDERSTAVNRSRSQIPRLQVEDGSRGLYDVNPRELRSVTILSVVVALVLLLVCANVANLLLSRAASRQKELSVRLSLGATRARLIRQLLTESLLLAFAGGGLGILVGYWGRQLLPGPATQMPAVDWRIVAFLLGVTVLAGVIFGLAPALRGAGMNVNAALKENGRSVIATRSVLGKSLLVAQVAISLVLLVGAGLFLRTLHNLRQVDVGFNPRNLVLFRVSPQLNRYDETRMAQLYTQMFERIGAVPGVKGVTMSLPALLSGSVNSTDIYVQGRVYPTGGERLDVEMYRLVVGPDFFKVMEIPLLSGRTFTAHDTDTSSKVVIINDAAARKFFPGENPLGRRVGNSLEKTSEFEIVGLVRDVRYNSVREPAPPTMYVPYRQARLGNAVFEVRAGDHAAASVGAVREAIRQIDPNLPLMDVSTQLEQIERRFAQEKVFAQAYTLFGAIALLIASVGLFGLMSYSVARRTNEIGIRMALGAQRHDVLTMVMRESMLLVVAGVVIGIAAAAAASRLVGTLLFGLPATDLPTVGAAILVMIVVSALAGYLPARRAAHVDPMVALRYE
jgi:predicted permease